LPGAASTCLFMNVQVQEVGCDVLPRDVLIVEVLEQRAGDLEREKELFGRDKGRRREEGLKE